MFKVLTDGCGPKRGTKYSACVDLFASEDVVIGAGETKVIGLGVCIAHDFIKAMPQCSSFEFDDEISSIFNKESYNLFIKSHYIQLMLRSSLGANGLILPNGVGVIDLDYRDEIKMIIHNPMKHNKYFKEFLPNGDYHRDYFYITNCGKIGQNTWENSHSDIEMFNNGRIYETYKKAQYALDNFYTKIKKGDKIAQATLMEHKGYLFGIESDVVRDGGLGSTGE